MPIIPHYSHIDYRAWGFRAGMRVRYKLVSSSSTLSDESAVNDAMAIALMLNCHIVDEMRGGIVGVDGWVPAADGRAHIARVKLLHDTTPMVEVVTTEEYIYPLELEAIALNIARAVRATCKVEIGNRGRMLSISIDGGTTAQIIGMPRIKHLPPLAHYEAMRQRSLLDLRDEILRRGLSSSDYAIAGKTQDSTDITRKIGTDNLQQKADAPMFALVLPSMKGLGEWETGPERNFVGELAGRLKKINGQDADSIRLLWDEALQEELCMLMAVGEKDAVLVIIGNEEQMQTAAKEVMQRCAEACRGIPREVRRRLSDNTTEFVRLLPAETTPHPNELPSTMISSDRVEAIRTQLPHSPFAREQRWLELGLHPEVVHALLDSPVYLQDIFDAHVQGGGRIFAPAAHFLSAELKAGKRAGFIENVVEPAALTKLLDAYRVGQIAQDGLAIGLEQFISGGMEALELYLEEAPEGIECDPEGWAQREVNRLWEEDATAKPASIMARAMERLMLEANGKVEGACLAEAVRATLG